MSWFLAFAGFSVLIILHEFGHFIVAKWTGMRVERFFLFFPPKLVSIKRGETEYGVGAIPAGGFVKISGMNPDEELPDEVAHRGYYRQPVWKRIAVIFAGPFVNFLIAFVLLFGLALGVERGTELGVAEVEDGSPAAAALEPGDRIVSVDGVTGEGEEELSERATLLADQVNTHKCSGGDRAGCRAAEPAELVVLRDGERVAVSVRPFFDGEIDRYRVGFRFEQQEFVPENLSLPGAAGRSVDTMWLIGSETISTIAQLFKAEKRDEITGIVGGYETTRQAIEFDTRAALTLLAVISLSLALINLFPFLPLDGGHIFWSLVEKVRGRAVPFAVMERAGVVGFMLVLMLFFIGLSNDIDRLGGEGFGIR